MAKKALQRDEEGKHWWGVANQKNSPEERHRESCDRWNLLSPGKLRKPFSLGT